MALQGELVAFGLGPAFAGLVFFFAVAVGHLVQGLGPGARGQPVPALFLAGLFAPGDALTLLIDGQIEAGEKDAIVLQPGNGQTGVAALLELAGIFIAIQNQLIELLTLLFQFALGRPEAPGLFLFPAFGDIDDRLDAFGAGH